MKVIALVGMPGSGKGEIVRLLKERGYHVVRMGDLVWEETARRGLKVTAENVGQEAQEEREKHGMGIWAERTAERVRFPLTFIDGVRGDAELDVFRRRFGEKLIVVSILCSPETRYQRIMSRRREDDTMTFEAFQARDKRELSWGIERALARADHKIINEEGIGELRDAFERLLAIILEE